jgi:hypothetical protein
MVVQIVIAIDMQPAASYGMLRSLYISGHETPSNESGNPRLIKAK